MSHGYLMQREKPTLCQTYGEPLSIKQLNFTLSKLCYGTQKIIGISDYLFKALDQRQHR